MVWVHPTPAVSTGTTRPLNYQNPICMQLHRGQQHIQIIRSPPPTNRYTSVLLSLVEPAKHIQQAVIII